MYSTKIHMFVLVFIFPLYPKKFYISILKEQKHHFFLEIIGHLYNLYRKRGAQWYSSSCDSYAFKNFNRIIHDSYSSKLFLILLLNSDLIRNWNIFAYCYSILGNLVSQCFLKSALVKKLANPCCYLNHFLCCSKLNPLFLVYQFCNLNQHP